MPLKQVPWAIGNGAGNPVEGARLSLKMATKGNRGVSGPLDMKVIPLPVPGGAVRVTTGSCVTPNDYLPDGGHQAYAMFEESSTDVDIPATGSSGGATRYLIARVEDPQYAGQMPADPATATYNSYALVSSIFGLTYPHVPLAKITQPASTGTITQSMITDIREVANPQNYEKTIVKPLLSGQGEWAQVVGTGEWFPNGGEFELDIPEWATVARISYEWLSVRYEGGRNGWGEMWVEFGPHKSASQRMYRTQSYMWDTVGKAANTYRTNWKVIDEVRIPHAIRGTRQLFVPKANKANKAETAASVDGNSGVALTVHFKETADAVLEG